LNLNLNLKLKKRFLGEIWGKKEKKYSLEIGEKREILKKKEKKKKRKNIYRLDYRL